MVKYEIETTIKLDNIIIEKRYFNNILMGYQLRPEEGYVMYDMSDENYILDEKRNKVPITYYYREVGIPINVPVENWTWVAISDDSIPNYTDKAIIC